ncbi:cysteine desulfurase family protein [Rhizobium changzhiense]|uniref:cysteine desulfurase family protein n=1 Tax=Rhizobium changzhiense TaxID=2692317 RepID=UPI0019D68424|nr:cysteine desulfurase family protein [Rhizobium changzhiense]
MVTQAIYLDGFASTPIAPEVRDAINQIWLETANAGSPHFAGGKASAEIAQARALVANLIGATPEEVTFTSGATESNNLILLGLAKWAVKVQSPRRRVVVSAIEHKAVLEPAAALSDMGFDVRVAPVRGDGIVDLAALGELVDTTTLLVSVMAVNNETGVIQPLKELIEIGHRAGAYVHSDIAQAAGKLAIDVGSLDLDYASLSAHKMYGPMGIGALYVSQAAPKPEPLLYGGGQQGGLRPGTEPVALIVGFGKAAELATRDLKNDQHSDYLFKRLLAQLELHQVRHMISTGGAPRVPGGGSIIIPGINADDVVLAVGKKVSVSTGSACTSGQLLTSHVLREMGIDEMTSRSILRIFVNRYNTEEEVDRAASIISLSVQKLAAATGPLHQ